MKLLEKIKMILFKPTEFFKKTDKKYSIKDSFKYLAILSLFAILMGTLTSYLLQPVFSGMMSSFLGMTIPAIALTSRILAFSLVYGYIMIIVSSFVFAGFLHIWLLIFGGKGNYKKTYHLYNHARTPSLLFSWIPFVGSFISLYTLYILIICTPITHKISKKRSAIIYLVPIVIFFILIGFAAFVAMTVLKANPGLIQNITA